LLIKNNINSNLPVILLSYQEVNILAENRLKLTPKIKIIP